ncbi:uncharacterized protein [Ptychodera flava]|uniref:uncharacterized protein n=1 Tax=Ptychodera flava TaxID=63121 RepID=UPI00396A9149
MAVQLPTMPTEFELFQKARSLGLIQREATNATIAGFDGHLPAKSEFNEAYRQGDSKLTSPAGKASLKLPMIKHPLSDRPQVSRSLRREVSGYQLFSFTSMSPRRWGEAKMEPLMKVEDKQPDSRSNSKQQKDQKPEKKRDPSRKNNSKAVQLLRLPVMRSKTNVDYLMKKQKEATQVHMKQDAISKKEHIDTVKSLLPKQKLSSQTDKVVSQQEKVRKQEDVRVIVSPKSKYDFLHRPVDYYTRKYPLVILDKEMRKKKREVFRALGKDKEWLHEFRIAQDMATSKSELLPVESSIEHYKGRVKPIKTVSGWIGGLQCQQKILHDRSYLPPNTS